MDIGVLLFAGPKQAASLAQMVEALGFDAGSLPRQPEPRARGLGAARARRRRRRRRIRPRSRRDQLADPRPRGDRVGGAHAPGRERRPRDPRPRPRRLGGAAHRQARGPGRELRALSRPCCRPIWPARRSTATASRASSNGARASNVPKVPVDDRRDRATRDRGRGAARRRASASPSVRIRSTSARCSRARAKRPRRRDATRRAVRFGAFVNCVVNDDVAVARDAVRGSAASFARFSSLRRQQRSTLAPAARGGGALSARALRHEGPHADRRRAHRGHRRRLRRLVRGRGAGRDGDRATRARSPPWGSTSVCVVPGSTGMPRDVGATSLRTLASEVVPALRG